MKETRKPGEARKQDADSRLRELARGFRANQLRAPTLEGRGKKEERLIEAIRQHVNTQLEGCKDPKAGLRGQRKAKGKRAYGLVYGKKNTYLLSPCTDQTLEDGRPVRFAEVDLDHLMAAFVQCPTVACRARILVRATGAGDFIQMPLLWWLKTSHPLVSYRRILSNEDFTLRSVLATLGLLSLNTAMEAVWFWAEGRDPFGEVASNRVFALAGHARHLFEAGLTYAYWSMSDQGPMEGAKVVVRLAQRVKDLVRWRSKEAWKALDRLLREHAWGDDWGLAETIVFTARTPLPPEFVNQPWIQQKDAHAHLRDELPSIFEVKP